MSHGKVLSEIARRLDIHPADLVPELKPPLTNRREPPWQCWRRPGPARNGNHARIALPDTEIIVGDLEDQDSLAGAARDVDTVIFVHGSDGDQRADSAERIDYGSVANVMRALDGRRPRIVLMTTFSSPTGSLLQQRRACPGLEAPVRAHHPSQRRGVHIVRPGWLDSGPGGDHVTIEQGDTTEGSISRETLSAVLLEVLLSTKAIGKTFEVFSGPGQATRDWNGLFTKAERDHPGALDAAKDTTNMPLDAEPSSVKATWPLSGHPPDAEDSQDD
jgi:hypothetical protein